MVGGELGMAHSNWVPNESTKFSPERRAYWTKVVGFPNPVMVSPFTFKAIHPASAPITILGERATVMPKVVSVKFPWPALRRDTGLSLNPRGYS